MFKLIPYAIAGLVIIAIVISVHNNGKRTGYANAINEIAVQDRSAIDAANKAKSSLASCRASGGMWDTTTGECRR